MTTVGQHVDRRKKMSNLSRAPKKALALTAMGLMLTLSACGDDDDDMMGPGEDNSIVGAALEAGSFSTLLTALDAAGLTSTLQGGSYTVFAPTDAAFDALPAGTLDGLLADTDALTNVLTYHVVQGEYSAAGLEELSSIETLQGEPIVITQGSVILNGVMVQQSVDADNGVIHVIDEVLLPPEFNIVETAVNTAGFSTLAAAVEAAGLLDALQADGSYTVFAPTDAAFAALPEGTLDALLADPAALAEVLTYHVVEGEVFARDLDGVVSTGTLAGYPVLFDLSMGAKINGVNIIATDILATNGVIHVIDEVLLPPEGDIVETAVAAGFSTLAAALVAGELVEALQGEGPFTVFAPTNEAFANLPEGVLDDLLLPENKENLQSILLYHVVEGEIFSGNLENGASAPTLQGQNISVDLSDGVKINTSNVTVADIITKNGVIHIIDAVLLPASN
jgi:uncharacterized surface protein with fasciclin (FAS1) repeats